MRHIILFLLVTFSYSLLASEFKEGEHYFKFSETASEKPQVREFMSFFCGHCYKFETTISELKSKLNGDVEFEKFPILIPRKTLPRDLQMSVVEAYVLAKALNIENKINDDIFSKIHKQNEPFSKVEEIKAFMISTGIDEDVYNSTVTSEAYTSLFAQHKKTVNDLYQKDAIRGVPAVIINNQFAINLPSLKGSSDKFVSLVNHLLAKHKK